MWWNNIEITKEFQEVLKDESASNEFVSNTKALLEIDKKKKTLLLFSDPQHHTKKILIGTLSIPEQDYDLCMKMMDDKDYKIALLHRKNESELIRNVSKALLDGSKIIKKE